MSQKKYNTVTGLIFLAVAIMHLFRVMNGTPVNFGSISIPLWVSWLGVLVAGFLSYQGLKHNKN
jgi:uncharacterized integral membrane protein